MAFQVHKLFKWCICSLYLFVSIFNLIWLSTVALTCLWRQLQLTWAVDGAGWWTSWSWHPVVLTCTVRGRKRAPALACGRVGRRCRCRRSRWTWRTEATAVVAWRRCGEGHEQLPVGAGLPENTGVGHSQAAIFKVDGWTKRELLGPWCVGGIVQHMRGLAVGGWVKGSKWLEEGE
jgi:hypothetical protein